MILFDLSFIFHRSLWANKEAVLQDTNFLPHLVITQILQYANKLGASKNNRFVICIDCGSWRKAYYDTNKVKFPEIKDLSYKGNRVKDDSIPWEKLYSDLNVVCEALKEYSDFFVVKVNDSEADDIIAVLTNEYKKKEEIIIVSPDKDFVQLQDTNVHLYDSKNNIYKPKIDVETFLKIHTMIGDASDNIKAIRPRLGEKTAIKILSDLPTLLATDPVLRERFEFNKNLIDFSCIPVYIKDAILEEFNKQKFNYNPTGLMKTFMKCKLSKLMEDLIVYKLNDNIVKTQTNQYFTIQQRNQEMEKSNLEDFFS